MSGLGHQLLWGDKCLEDTFQSRGRTGGWRRGTDTAGPGVLSAPLSFLCSRLGYTRCPCPHSPDWGLALHTMPCIPRPLTCYFKGTALRPPRCSLSRQPEWILTSSWDVLQWDYGCVVHLSICCCVSFSLQCYPWGQARCDTSNLLMGSALQRLDI